jgi:hypothetical protein
MFFFHSNNMIISACRNMDVIVECLTVILLFLVAITVCDSQSTQLRHLTEFKLLLSHDGAPACAVGTVPYRSYAVDRINVCMYDCHALSRVTSSASSCIGFNFNFNFNELNSTCELFTLGQRLYFYVHSTCKYFMVSRTHIFEVEKFSPGGKSPV